MRNANKKRKDGSKVFSQPVAGIKAPLPLWPSLFLLPEQEKQVTETVMHLRVKRTLAYRLLKMGPRILPQALAEVHDAEAMMDLWGIWTEVQCFLEKAYGLAVLPLARQGKSFVGQGGSLVLRRKHREPE